MATYFGYAEKQADSYINWAAIGKSMSDTLAEEMRIREEKKAAIDNSSIEFGQELDKAPQGEHKGMNQWALEYANNAQQARLMQDKLLKSGQLSLKDYMVMRQNVTDGTSQAFDLMKEYQDEYKIKMDAYNKGESSEIEPWLMGEVEGFANFSESSLYINPTTGVVNIGKMVVGEDGVRKMSDNPNDFATINSLRNRIKTRYKKFDVKSNVDKYVSTLGDELNTLIDIKDKYSRGTVTELLDITQRTNLPADAQGVIKTFEQAENDMLQSLIVNPNDAASVLLDAVDFVPGTSNMYTPTWSEQEAAADPSKILYKTDPKSGIPAPQLSEEQKRVIMDHLKTQARLMYDKKVTVNVVGASETPRPTQAEIDAQNAKTTKQSLLQDWQLLRNGNDEQKKAALDAIKGSPNMIARGLTRLYIQGDKVYFEYDNPKLNTNIDISDNADAFIRAGKEVYGATTEEELAKYATGAKVKASKGLESKRGEEYGDFSKNLRSDMNRDQYFVMEDKPDETAAHLNAMYGNLGIKVVGNPDGETITISDENDRNAVEFNISNFDSIRDIKNHIINISDKAKLQNKYQPKGVGSKY
jgi:hypothetical protein